MFELSVITASTGSRELPFICVRGRAPVLVCGCAVELSPLRRVYLSVLYGTNAAEAGAEAATAVAAAAAARREDAMR